MLKWLCYLSSSKSSFLFFDFLFFFFLLVQHHQGLPSCICQRSCRSSDGSSHPQILLNTSQADSRRNPEILSRISVLKGIFIYLYLLLSKLKFETGSLDFYENQLGKCSAKFEDATIHQMICKIVGRCRKEVPDDAGQARRRIRNQKIKKKT